MANPYVVPRPEYPRPQMRRESWINLNGYWEFEIDHGKSGRARKLFDSGRLSDSITVPFCPESKLSGVEYKDFMAAVWYIRTFSIPDEWISKKVLLHFGAVDYEAEVWVNGVSAGSHRGGYSSFYLDITKYLLPGENTIAVCAEDDVRSGAQPRGKQSSEYYSHGCDYTRTTGIWQTVWLECVPETYIVSTKYIPDLENGSVHIEVLIEGCTDDCILNVKAFYGSKEVGSKSAAISGNRVYLSLELSEIHPWGPGEPNLYDLVISLQKKTKCIDIVESYFGLRSVAIKNNAIYINGKPVFQRLVLDQGFYPDGIYTAPTDEDLKRDIQISMELGFNGARLHQKIFEQRFLYWADRLGYLVWGEHASWGLDITKPSGLEQFLPEWMEAIERDFNSPAVIGWCPFNETWDWKDRFGNGALSQDNDILRIVYQITKMIDATRPVIDTSGNYHVITDVFDIHDYEQDPKVFAAKFEAMKTGGEVFNGYPERQRYDGQPYFVSEYGGIWWNPEQADGNSWGYGARPTTKEEFLDRYEKLTKTLLENPNICAFCYTQLYDVEQEVNGLYTYERKPKFDPAVIKNINSLKAVIEE